MPLYNLKDNFPKGQHWNQKEPPLKYHLKNETNKTTTQGRLRIESPSYRFLKGTK